jgi:membrane-associated phospholipid phosphatase
MNTEKEEIIDIVEELKGTHTKGKWGKFYNFISIVFMPMLIPLYMVLYLFQLDFFTARFYSPEQLSVFKWVTISATALFTLILPTIPIIVLRKKGEVSDLFISKREQRFVPYLLGFLAYAFWTYFLWHVLRMPMYVVGLGIGSTISIFLVLLINFKWKISAHMAGVGGFVGGVFGLCWNAYINPVWFFILIIFISILVGLARVELRAHTPSQVLAGFMLGFLIVFLCCVRF